MNTTANNNTTTIASIGADDAMGSTPVEHEPDWAAAGDAWSHAALDWAYRFEPYNRDAIEHVFGRLDVGPDRALLDVACGSGYALGRAERLGATTAGIDVSDGLIEIARRRAPSCDLVVGTMFDLPWDDESFDVVTSFNGIWGGCDDAVAEAARVLRPGGSLALSFWGPGRALDLRDFFIVLGTTAAGAAEELMELASIGAPGVAEAMFDAAGFDIVERTPCSAVLEFVDDDDAWRTLRSPGVVIPSLQAVGEDELRRLALEALAPFRAPDGSYRLVNEVTTVIGRLR